jgi:predicted Zn-dependent peptidase
MSVNVTRLKSGLTVVTDEMPHLETAAVGVWAGTGGRDELVNEHGISHLLEHMAFKGTTTRSARQIAEEIEAVGGDMNAATSAENTSYYARILKADTGLAIDLLSDILANPTFETEELEREKNVIVQEIGAAQDAPDDVVFEHLQELCFPEQPLGRSLLGTPDTLASFSADNLRKYLLSHYRAPNMGVAAAGAVDHDKVVRDVEERFASFAASPAAPPPRAQFGGGTRVVYRELEQAHMMLALEGVAITDPGNFNLEVFTNVLGGGMSSRLFQEIREKRGLCYSISSFHWAYADTGVFGIYTGADAGDAPELMKIVVDEMNKAVQDLNEAEVARVKAQMKASTLMALESCGARIHQLARHIFAFGRPLTTAEMIARIDAVTVESARKAGEVLLSRSRPSFAAIGAGSGLERAIDNIDGLVRLAA